MTFQDIKFVLDIICLMVGLAGLFFGVKWLRESGR